MAGSDGRINFQVGFTTDEAGLNKLKSSLESLKNLKLTDFQGTEEQLKEVQNEARKVQNALEKAFNPKMGTLNTQTFLAEVKDLDQVYQKFSMAGTQGRIAFNRMASSVLTTNLQLKETNSLIGKFGTSLVNAFKWSIASSAIKTLTTGIQSAFQYTEALQRSLTNIRIVTGDSTEKMSQFADQANRAATELGRSTLDYTKASLTFYQQGLNDEDVQARTEATLKAQNITGAGTQMADYLTSVWNGYKVANQQAELYVDKLAAVADSSASDMSQLAIAMSKVASTANNMGVSVDQLNAQIATVVATTRQAPESVGTAFKTIYTRLNDIKTGADDAEVSLGNYSGQMATLGINVLDQNNHLRDTGQIMEEIGGKWQDLTKEQQIYLARTMGGQRQVNQLIALFDNWTTYSNLLNTSLQSQGTLAEKNARYMESLAAKMQQLGAAGQRIKRALIDADDMKGLISVLTSIEELLANVFESFGSGTNVLLTFGGIFTQVFSGTIAKEINNVIASFQTFKNNMAIKEGDLAATEAFGRSQGYNEKAVEAMVKQKEALHEIWDVMSPKEINIFNDKVAELGEAVNKQLIAESDLKVFDLFSKKTNDANTALTNLQETLQKIDLKKISVSDDQQISETYDKLLNSFQELANAAGDADPRLKRIAERFKNIQKEGRVSHFALAKFIQICEKVGIDINEVLMQDRPQLEKNINNAKQEADGLEATLEKLKESTKQLFNIKNVVELAGALSQAASALRSISNIKNIIDNDNLTDLEKATQIITNVSFAAFGLINVFNKLKNIANISGLASAFGGLADSLGAVFGVTISGAGLAAAAIAGVVAVIAGAIIIYDKLHLSVKQATKALNESKQSLKQQQQEVKKLDSELTNIKNRIDELSNKGALTVAEQTELAKLQAQRVEVEERLKAEELITQEKLKQVAIDAENKYGRGKGEKGQSQANAFELGNGVAADFNKKGGNLYTYTNNDGVKQTRTEHRIGNAYAQFFGENNFTKGADKLNQIDTKLNFDQLLQARKSGQEKIAAYTKQIEEFKESGASKAAIQAAEQNKRFAEAALSILNEQIKETEDFFEANRNEIKQAVIDLSADKSSDAYKEAYELQQQSLKESGRDKTYTESILSNLNLDSNELKLLRDNAGKALEEISNGEYGEGRSIIASIFDDNGWISEMLEEYQMDYTLFLENIGNITDENIEARKKRLQEASEEELVQEAFSNIGDLTTTGQKLTSGKSVGIKQQQNFVDQAKTVDIMARAQGNTEIADAASLLTNTAAAETEEYAQALQKVLGYLAELANKKIQAQGISALSDEETESLETYCTSLERYHKLVGQGKNNTLLFNVALQKEADALKIDVKAIKEHANQLEKTQKVRRKAGQTEQEYQERLQETALNNIKYADSFNNLSKNFNDWDEILKNSEPGVEDYDQTITKLTDSINQFPGFHVQSDQVVEHLDLIRQAANGSEESLIELQRALSIDEVEKLKLDVDAPDAEDFNQILDEINSLIGSLSPEEIKTRSWCDNSAFIQQLNQLLSSASITATQANAILSSIGGKAVIKTRSVPIGPSAVVSGKNTQTDIVNQHGLGEDTQDVRYTEVLDSYYWVPNDTPDTGRLTEAASPKGSGGGGGGGGGGAEKDPKKEQLIKDERDAYYEINKQLSKLETQYKHVSDAQKKAFGQGAIDLLDEQNNLIDKQIDKYEEKIKLIDEQNAKLQKAAADANYEAVFDPNTGELTSYSELYESELKKVNDVIEKYNKVGEQQGLQAQKQLDQELKDAKQRWEDFKDWLSKFDANVELKKETIQSIRQQLEEKIELNIEKFKVKIDLDLDLAEAQREWNEFKKKVIDKVWKDDVIKNTKATLQNLGSYYDGEGGGAIPALTEHVNATLEEIEKLRNEEDGVYGIFNAAGGISSSNLKQALEDLKDYSQKLMENLEAVEDLLDQVKQAFFDMIDAAQKAFDEQNKEYDYLSKLLDHDKSVIQMLYGDKAFDKLDKYNKQQIENDKRQMDFNKQQKDFWYSQMQAEKARMATLDKESNAYKESEERFKTLQEHWMSSLETFNQGLENSIQHIVDRYNNTIDSIVDKLDKKLSGSGLGIDYDKEEWERINKMTERYLNPVQRLIDLQDIDDTFKDALKNAEGNIKAQKSLQNIYNTQLKILKDKDKLSKYDVDRANLLIELETKKIALEQSRQNTSKLRLRRDSQGNYTYQYVADQTAIQEAEKEVRDLYGQLTDLNINRFNEIKQEFPEATKKYLEDLAEYEKDANLSPEQRQKKISDLNNYYNQNYKGLADAYQTVRKNLEQDIPNAMSYLQGYNKDFFQNMAQDEKNAFMESIIPTWNSSIDDMINKINGQGGLEQATKDSFNEMDAATKQYQTSLGELEKAADVSFKAIAEGLDQNIPKTEELIEDNGTLIGTYEDEAAVMRDVLKQVEALTKGFEEQQKAAIAAAEAARQMYNELAKVQTERQDQDYDQDNENSSDANTIESWGKKSDTDQGWRSYNLVGDSESHGPRWKYLDENEKPLTGTHTLFYEGKMAEYTFDGNGELLASEQHPTHDGWYGASNLREATEEEKRKYGYATGGYTGSWGSDAKLAFLHQKELVLNEDDTENMLRTVDIVRAMKDELDMLQNNVYESLFSLNPYNNNGFSNDSVLEQNVHITATFPNVNSSREIEDAFNNLVNRASQYAYRSKVI